MQIKICKIMLKCSSFNNHVCLGTASKATPQGHLHCANTSGKKVGFKLATASISIFFCQLGQTLTSCICKICKHKIHKAISSSNLAMEVAEVLFLCHILAQRRMNDRKIQRSNGSGLGKQQLLAYTIAFSFHIKQKVTRRCPKFTKHQNLIGS